MLCKIKSLFIVAAFITFSLVSRAQIRLPKIIGSNMILQREQVVPIWGWAEANKKVTVKFAGQEKIAKADAKGYWKVLFNPLKLNDGTQTMLITSDTSVVKLTGILVGDVWVCAGQSNINFMLNSDLHGADEKASGGSETIREFRSVLPAEVVPGTPDASQWVSANDTSKLGNFSAVAYYFAKRLQTVKHVPVGIIVLSSGNTHLEVWTDTTDLKKNEALKPLMMYWSTRMNDRTSKANFKPGKFYYTTVVPIVPFSVKGVIWYQGESNTLPDKTYDRPIDERTAEYKPLLKTLINNWREIWNKPDLPFYVVQLPNYTAPGGDIQWAKIRQAQLETAKEVAHTSLIVTIDVGGGKNLHPRNKMPAGERTANLILANEYGDHNGEVSGPIIEGLTSQPGRAILTFKHIGKGLMSKQTDGMGGFEISDQANPAVFLPATATIVGSNIEVSNAQVNNPVAVRYAWADDPIVSLFNKDGLPASPFIIKKQ